VNSVALTGTVVDDPQLSSGERGGDVCVMRIAVPRRSRGGRREPGVVYVDVAAFGAGAHESAARLREGDRIGLAGRLSREEYRAQGGGRRVDHAVLIEQLNLPVKRPY
jgi:single-stranded DNA-binding protein